ncbi:MAG: hypothetical protein AAF654_07050 [Myxococcota bacterium]
MSTKVVHLSTDAHALAKKHCKENGLKMSDWVANLIRQAISESKKETIANNVRDLVPQKKRVAPSPSVSEEQEVPAWAQPPFWASRARTNG